MVEVRATRKVQLCKELWQAIVLPEGVNQQCLLPVGQELQVDAQAFPKKHQPRSAAGRGQSGRHAVEVA